MVQARLRQPLVDHVQRDVGALVLLCLEVFASKDRAVDMLLGGPNDVLRVQIRCEAHGPRAVEVLAVMDHLVGAIGESLVPVVLHLRTRGAATS